MATRISNSQSAAPLRPTDSWPEGPTARTGWREPSAPWSRRISLKQRCPGLHRALPGNAANRKPEAMASGLGGARLGVAAERQPAPLRQRRQGVLPQNSRGLPWTGDNVVGTGDLVSDLTHNSLQPLASLEPGEGALMRHDGQTVVASRDPDGTRIKPDHPAGLTCRVIEVRGARDAVRAGGAVDPSLGHLRAAGSRGALSRSRRRLRGRSRIAARRCAASRSASMR